MRKYRNGKQSREPRRLSKYSPEYIQYRENRGGYSVKVGLCDITGDGEEDTISVAWRNPANGKVQTCAKGYVQSTPPAPSGISALASPQVGPTNILVTAPPQVGPTGISADIPVSTILIYHGMGGVLDSSSRNQTNVPTDGSVWTDIQASNWDNGLHYNPHIIVPTFPNAVEYALTLTNETTTNNAGIFDRISGINPAGGPAPTYTFFDNRNSVAQLTGRTVIRINWLDSNGNTVADEAVLRITLV